MCNCGKNKTVKSATTSVPNVANMSTAQAFAATTTKGVDVMRDDEMVMVRYEHPNRGMHTVVGPATRTNYGMRRNGDTFLVNKADVAAARTLFAPIETERVGVPATPQPVPPAPVKVKVVVPDEPEPILAVIDENEMVIQQTKSAGVMEKLDLQTLPGVSAQIAEGMIAKGLVSREAIINGGIEALSSVKGIGQNRAAIILRFLEENGEEAN